ncbi:hypothetical protein ODJ79_15895 [Actinoplanes sp. KI2]|uniref:hypothetical protein n=1 Tax=Actinoplanes sp. KI2 TaxID=2983315 RepID=UPI0021D5FFBC|nr:hypothetical protein [Actinoplanes sp. KI2]MCU7725211.1 hypothetical protein [Actinoplanes sp. KI2]
MAAGVAIVLAGTVGVAGSRWWHNRPPYGPEALSARATLRLVDQATADAAVKPAPAVVANDGDQIFLGQVTWNRPPRPQKNGSFRIVLLDKRRHLTPGYLAVTSPKPDAVSSGSDHALDIAQERYPWLQGAGAQPVDGSGWVSGETIDVESMDAAPVTFQAVLRRADPQRHPMLPVATAPTPLEDLLVALICVGPDGQVYWAQRLLH